jgi:hypothetical protein
MFDRGASRRRPHTTRRRSRLGLAISHERAAGDPGPGAGAASSTASHGSPRGAQRRHHGHKRAEPRQRLHGPVCRSCRPKPTALTYSVRRRALRPSALLRARRARLVIWPPKRACAGTFASCRPTWGVHMSRRLQNLSLEVGAATAVLSHVLARPARVDHRPAVRREHDRRRRQRLAAGVLSGRGSLLFGAFFGRVCSGA